jgi:plastocyanin
MHSNILIVATLVMLAAVASAITHRVEVGRRGGLGFAPNNITADEGDIVEFHFNAMHSVVAGDFKKPCTPVTRGGFYSGTMPKGDKVS